MKYLWTEDTGAGLHFWQLVNQLFFEGKLIVESKESNQGILDAIYQLQPDTGDIYYIVFDYVVRERVTVVTAYLGNSPERPTTVKTRKDAIDYIKWYRKYNAINYYEHQTKILDEKNKEFIKENIEYFI